MIMAQHLYFIIVIAGAYVARNQSYVFPKLQQPIVVDSYPAHTNY